MEEAIEGKTIGFWGGAFRKDVESEWRKLCGTTSCVVFSIIHFVWVFVLKSVFGLFLNELLRCFETWCACG